MITTTDDFLVAARSNPRKCKAKLDFVWTDPTIDPSISVSSNDANRAARLDQVYDGELTISRQWAHLDGVIKANGQYNPMPSDSTTTFNQCGWYGATRCDAGGEWVTNPELTLEFDARPILVVSVVGETNYEEYPVDFDIRLYSGVGGTVLEHTEVVTGNVDIMWAENLAPESLTDITKMVLEVKEWSHPNRVVKIAEFYSIFRQTIDAEDIVSFSLLEERVLADGTLPVGNISSNEIDITLQNIEITVEGVDYVDPFIPANTNSIYHTLITKNRKVTPYLGYELAGGSIEYVKLGTFWTGDWDVNEQSATAKVTARDRMELLRLAEFKGSTLYQDTTLYDLMIAVLTDAKTSIPMPDLTWFVDTELQSYSIPYAWFPKQSYFKTIKDIVAACMGQAYMNREDVLTIEGPSALTS